MKRLLKAAFAAALLAGMGSNALAIERGGELKFGRYADSLFLVPVLNEANVDSWIMTNLFDTLLQPSADGKGVEPGLARKRAVWGKGVSVRVGLGGSGTIKKKKNI